MQKLIVLAVVVLTGCQKSYTPEGCEVRYGQIGAAYTQACVAAYHHEMARRRGDDVTTCYQSYGQMTCVSEHP